MKSLLCASVAASLLLAGAPARAQYPEGHWQNFAPYPQPTQEVGGAVVNGKLYILGAYGANAPGGLAGWLNEYDPAADKWTKKADIPMPVHHQAMTGFRDKIYVFGGGVKISPTSDNWYPTNRVWEYTPATNAWRELGPMPTKRGGGIALVMNNRIWVIGGAGYHPLQTDDVSIAANVPHRTVNTVEVFDPATGMWETKAPMLVPRNHLAGGVVNGKIYVMGGRIGSSFVGASSTDAVEEYDPATDTWRVRARMPYPRSGMAFASDGKLIYMSGGEYLNRDMVGVFRNAEAYDPARNLWYELPPMSVARHGFAGGIINGVFYTATGQLQSGTGGGGPGGSPAVEGFVIGKPAPGGTR